MDDIRTACRMALHHGQDAAFTVRRWLGRDKGGIQWDGDEPTPDYVPIAWVLEFKRGGDR